MKKLVLLNALLCLALATPAWAASKSATVRVSCTIPELVQLSAPALDQPITANTNLGSQYQVTENTRDADGRRMRIYSLTAL